MIETHVSNATLAPEILSSVVFRYVNFINGLVAPSFLFASGMAYAVTTRRKLNDYLSLGPPLFKQLLRVLLILVIGYCLHLPVFSLRAVLTETTVEQWEHFFQVDILQCIAVTLLCLQLILLLVRNELRLYSVAAVLGVTFVVAAPFIWQVDFWTMIPWPIAAYMNGIRHSLFPLFPWSAFLLAGGLTGYFFARSRERTVVEGTDPTWRSLLWIGGSAILLGIAIEPLIPNIYPSHDYWRSGPGFFFLRLGIIMMLCGLMHLYQHARGVSSGSVVTLFGRESLLVYVLHLQLIYGTFGSFNFKEEAGQSFAYTEAAIATVVLIGLMYASAFGWSRIKRTSPRWKMIFTIATLALVVGLFVFGEG
jgi:uncharacterized membrane protein